MTIFTTTYSTLPRLSSKKRMVSLIVFGSHTNRTYGSTHGNYPTTATTTETSSRSIHGNSRLYHNHAHPFRSLSSTAMKTTKVSSSWRSCSSSIRMMTPEPQLALAYNDIDTEDDPENDGDCDDDRVLYSTKHHNFGSNDGHATNSTTGNNNITTTTTATTTANSTTTPGGSTNHGGGGGGGGSRRHRCPKVRVLVLISFQ